MIEDQLPNPARVVRFRSAAEAATRRSALRLLVSDRCGYASAITLRTRTSMNPAPASAGKPGKSSRIKRLAGERPEWRLRVDRVARAFHARSRRARRRNPAHAAPRPR